MWRPLVSSHSRLAALLTVALVGAAGAAVVVGAAAGGGAGIAAAGAGGLIAGTHAAVAELSTIIGSRVQDDAHTPQPWRALTPAEQKLFDIGLATFNTEWSPANAPAGRTDGLGPLFNAQSCDACHNSRRRGRGPRGDGEAPADLVMQLGRRLSNGSIERGSADYGFILNTASVDGYTREAGVFIQYDGEIRLLADGTRVSLRTPRYSVRELSGPPLSADAVLMPRVPGTVMGAGLLELVPVSALEGAERAQRRSGGAIRGSVSWVKEEGRKQVGRFGWQATEPSVRAQTARAMSREMGLTSLVVSFDDCGKPDAACKAAPAGGSPEVPAELFDALLLFQQLHAVPIVPAGDAEATAPAPALTSPARSGMPDGQLLFVQTGCAMCHQLSLPVKVPGERAERTIQPRTDLLLHDLGRELADRNLDDEPVNSRWRTAPLWGLSASVASSQPLRLLHDGRARSVIEAVLWHGGEARGVRERFVKLPANEREALVKWVEAQ